MRFYTIPERTAIAVVFRNDRGQTAPQYMVRTDRELSFAEVDVVGSDPTLDLLYFETDGVAMTVSRQDMMIWDLEPEQVFDHSLNLPTTLKEKMIQMSEESHAIKSFFNQYMPDIDL